MLSRRARSAARNRAFLSRACLLRRTYSSGIASSFSSSAKRTAGFGETAGEGGLMDDGLGSGAGGDGTLVGTTTGVMTALGATAGTGDGASGIVSVLSMRSGDGVVL